MDPAIGPELLSDPGAIVGEIVGLNLRRTRRDGAWVYSDRVEFDRRWAEVEHIETTLRLVLARRLGRLSPWTDWIYLDPPIVDDNWWREVIVAAWEEVDGHGQ